VNTQKVYGAEGVYGEFTYNHRVTYDGIIEGEPIQDDNILNNAEAFEIARATVLSSVYRDRKVTAHSLQLLNAIPGITTVELTEMPYGLSGKYIVDSVRISIDASGGIDVSSELRRRSSLSRSYNISDALRNVLGPSTSRP
jgi:hypothetical protein